MRKRACLAFVFSIFVSLLLINCDPPFFETFFLFKNESNQTLGLIIRHVPPETEYLRTECIINLYMPPGENAFNITNGDPKGLKSFSNYPKLYLYVFDVDTLTKYYDDAIEYKLIENRRELKLIELTKEYMESHNWTVTYP